MISYFVEFALIHLLLFGIYVLLLRKETQLTFLRHFLLASFLFALLIPLIKIPTSATISSMDIAGSVTTLLLLPEVTITGGFSETHQNAGNTIPWITWIFIGGAFCAAFRLMINLIRIYKIYKHSIPIELHGRSVRHMDHLKSSFTFIKWIFIDKDHFEDPIEIICHEEAHIKYKHSFDLLLVNLFTIPFWWVPSIWLSIPEFKKVHEYQADAYALKIFPKGQYIRTMVEGTLKDHGIWLANSFNDTPIIKRLEFMKRIKKTPNVWKISSVIAFCVVTILTFSCEEKLEADTINDEKAISEHESKDSNNIINEKYKELTAEYPDVEFAVMEIPSGKDLSDLEPAVDINKIKFLDVRKVDEHTSFTTIIIEKSGLKGEIIEPKGTNQSDEIFLVVEQPPEFPGGIREAFFEYVIENINYPKEAVQKGIAGKVFVQFIVDENGEIKDAKVVKGIGAGCDEEALRIVQKLSNMDPWEARWYVC